MRRFVGPSVALLVSTLAVTAAIGLCLVVIALVGKPPGAAALALWDGAFGGRQEIAGTLEKAIPLALVALGWIVAYTAYRINVGFEGQIVIGGICAAVVGLQVHGLPRIVHLPLAIAAGVAGGGVFAGIAAWLWAKRNVNEIISTLLLNFVAIQFLGWLIRGPLQEPTHSTAESLQITASAQWPRMLAHTPLAWDVLYIPFAATATAFLLVKTVFGFRLRLTGANENAARYAGVKTMRVGAYALVLSGALAGLAGSSLILSGESGTLADNFSANYGFDGIVVALLARNSPAGVLPAALLLAALRQGGAHVEAQVGISSALVQIIQGVVIVLIAGSAFVLHLRLRRRALREPRPAVSPQAESFQTDIAS
jgi:simple sugar transport system permease protein